MPHDKDIRSQWQGRMIDDGSHKVLGVALYATVV
jgi:hypothetical protein